MSGLKQLCVYTHSANGRVFYVGQGSSTRAYNRHARTPRWEEYVKNVGSLAALEKVAAADRRSMSSYIEGLIVADLKEKGLIK